MTTSREERLSQIRDILKYCERETLVSRDVYDLSNVVTRIVSELVDLIDIISEEEKGSVITCGLPIEDYNVSEQTEAFEKAGWSNG